MQTNSNVVPKKRSASNEQEVLSRIFEAIDTLDSFFISQKLKKELNSICSGKENIEFDFETYVDLCHGAKDVLTYAEYGLFTKEKHSQAIVNLVQNYKDARNAVVSNAERPKGP